MGIKAIETRYKGYRFRSRLEARWAVFFDYLGIEWQYEPEGYDLGDAGKYLPDFYLPGVDGGYWLEVKGDKQAADSNALWKMAALCGVTDKRGLLVYGEPMLAVEAAMNGTESPWWEMTMAEDGCDAPYIFCVCPWCGKVGIEFDGRGARVCGWQAHCATEEDALAIVKPMGHGRVDDKCYTGDDPRIVAAASAARAARFEHGENGAA